MLEVIMPPEVQEAPDEDLRTETYLINGTGVAFRCGEKRLVFPLFQLQWVISGDETFESLTVTALDVPLRSLAILADEFDLPLTPEQAEADGIDSVDLVFDLDEPVLDDLQDWMGQWESIEDLMSLSDEAGQRVLLDLDRYALVDCIGRRPDVDLAEEKSHA